MHWEHDTETSSMIHKRVCERAYELWVERGCPEGSPDHDWYTAVHEIEGLQSTEAAPDTAPNPFIYTAAV
jgi:hypothetical protein